jgi:hypothetical protein
VPTVGLLREIGALSAVHPLTLRQLPVCSHWSVSPVLPGTTRQRVRAVPSLFVPDRVTVRDPSVTVRPLRWTTCVPPDPTAPRRTRSVGLPRLVDRVVEG